MRALDHFLHLFTPRHSNGQRARLLHASSLSIYIAIVIAFQLLVTAISHFQPQVLGYATNINTGDLLNSTNDKRAQVGVGALSMDSQLSAAAAAKASDMFASQYWAHTSPSGKDPWSFINSAGYNYLFAGENLARDFADSASVVDAWMNSPTHRENLVNGKYKDVGFAIVNGKYGDSETTLVVQMFGARAGGSPTVTAPTAAPAPAPLQVPLPEATSSSQASPSAMPEKPPVTPEPIVPSNGLILKTGFFNSQPKVDISTLTKNVTFALTLFLITLLVVDAALVYKRRSVRATGHNFAHLMILFALLAAMNLFTRGLVL